MSTRSVIARPNGEGHFFGRYHHWDGYPAGVGATLFELAQPGSPFDGDTDRMLAVLIDEHPAGWSTINNADWSQAPGFTEFTMERGPCQFIYPSGRACGKGSDAHLCQSERNKNVKRHATRYPCQPGYYANHLGHQYFPPPPEKRSPRPECYCHGERSEEGWDVTEENAAGSGCEYAYVIDGRKMTVLSSYTSIGSSDGTTSEKMVGFFGMGDDNAEWRPIGHVDFDEPEPDWGQMA